MSQWGDLEKLLARPSTLATPDFDHALPYRSFLAHDCRILVVGAGGLGCELLKDLALCGFGNIDVIDMDTIDLSNLNRQFLFRTKDIGQSKAVVAANFINARVKGCKVTPHFCRIESYDASFYKQFNLVVCGLDSITARRWINGMLLDLVVYEDGAPLPQSVIPFVDGGTEGFKGNARVIWPGKTACIECTMDLYPPQVTYPLCTIENTPRLPEHCVTYVKVLQWPKENPDTPLDGDNPEHVKWVFEKASERAAQFSIFGVTQRLTQGVIKNIIPAVASTNAVVAAVTANEAFKLATGCCASLDNYMLFNDVEGVYGYTFRPERKDDCFACSNGAGVEVAIAGTATLEQLRLQLVDQLRLETPGLTTVRDGQNVTLYMAKGALCEATTPNLALTLNALGLANGHVLNVTDRTSPRILQVVLRLSDA